MSAGSDWGLRLRVREADAPDVTAEGDVSDRRRLLKHMMHEELGITSTEVGQVVCALKETQGYIALCHKSRV